MMCIDLQCFQSVCAPSICSFEKYASKEVKAIRNMHKHSMKKHHKNHMISTGHDSCKALVPSSRRRPVPGSRVRNTLQRGMGRLGQPFDIGKPKTSGTDMAEII